MNAPALPLPEVQQKYADCGEIQELPGERTFLGRCNTLTRFLENGEDCAAFLRFFEREGQGDEQRALHPRLAALLLECWPRATLRDE